MAEGAGRNPPVSKLLPEILCLIIIIIIIIMFGQFMERRYLKVSSQERFTILDIVGADFYSIFICIQPLFNREAYMLLDPSQHPLRVAMHNLLTPTICSHLLRRLQGS